MSNNFYTNEYFIKALNDMNIKNSEAAKICEKTTASIFNWRNKKVFMRQAQFVSFLKNIEDYYTMNHSRTISENSIKIEKAKLMLKTYTEDDKIWS